MWAGVTARFSGFSENVLLSDTQIADGMTKARNITSSLNAAYWSHADPDLNRLLVGSWGKTTQARPPRDLDMFFELTEVDWTRINALSGNKQSQLLQEVKRVLQATYTQTEMRGDGQVVSIDFNDITVEVLPVFRRLDGKYYFADSNGGGRWRMADPHAEIAFIENSDILTTRNLRPAIRMLKIWKRECNVGLDSYVLETLIAAFLKQWPYRHESWFYFDWLMRDFFAYLVPLANHTLTVADGQQVFLGEDWKSRAENAYARARRACDYERANLIADAGDEWQKIFGTWILKHVTPEPTLLLLSA